jgi:ubiquinone/menaquinone biosynthesis C-methylase UbiE
VRYDAHPPQRRGQQAFDATLTMKSNPENSYDVGAKKYAEFALQELQHKPSDRNILDQFASRVRGTVCDLGCGPGHIGRYLRDRGVNIVGLDLSSKSIKEARRLNPDISYIKANMSHIPVEDGSWGGIAAFYSLCHIPRRKVSGILLELNRTLEMGGLLLLAFHSGKGTHFLTQRFGKAIALETTFFTLPELVNYLKQAGFGVEAWLHRPPYLPHENANWRGYILAKKMTESSQLLPVQPPASLWDAVQIGSLESVEALLSQGVAQNVFFEGFTELHMAAGDGRLDVLDLLLRRGGNPNIQCKPGPGTPLHFTILLGQVEAARKLVEAGANPSETDSYGNTPLHIACWSSRLDVAKWLLSLGINPQPHNARGQTPLSWVPSHCLPLLKLLREACARQEAHWPKFTDSAEQP